MQDCKLHDDDEDDEIAEDESNLATEDNFLSSTDTISEIIDDVIKLHENAIVDGEVKQKAKSLKASLIFERDKTSTGVTKYKKKDEDENELHSQFLQVKSASGKIVYIRKRTAIWLLQDTERVSSDRLFRVRAQQPHQPKEATIKTSAIVPIHMNARQPILAEHIVIGDVCAFTLESTHHFKIGRILAFVGYDKNGKTFSNKGNYVKVDDSVGVLCTWYILHKKEERTFRMSSCTSNVGYYPISRYVSTLTQGCFEDNHSSEE